MRWRLEKRQEPSKLLQVLAPVGAVLLTVTYLLFARTTTFITLPGGEKVMFGSLNGSPSPPATATYQRDGTIRSGATSAQIVQEIRAQAAQLHAFEMHELLLRSGIALGASAVLSVALGYLVAGRVLRPIRTISATARQISARNLGERLSLDGPDDEFRELAATLDALLDRLQASFETQRRFVADASHELRTPLTLDRALLERALRTREPTQELWRATCTRLLDSSQAQSRLVEALLALARSETGIGSYESFPLARVIDEVLLGPELAAAAPGIEIRTDLGPAMVHGDPRLIERLVRNLADNATRYNHPGGLVEMSTTTVAGHAVLTVANTGPTFPAGEISRLFQPFQRLESHRTGSTDGTGLGLSIVKATTEAHDATLTATPAEHGGLRIEITFPPPDAPGATQPDPHGDGQTTRHHRERHRRQAADLAYRPGQVSSPSASCSRCPART